MSIWLLSFVNLNQLNSLVKYHLGLGDDVLIIKKFSLLKFKKNVA